MCPWPGILSAQQVSRLVAGAPRHLDHRAGRARPSGRADTGWEGRQHPIVRRERREHPSMACVIPRWSRCEPRAASLETDCTGAGFGPRWPGTRVQVTVNHPGLRAASLVGYRVVASAGSDRTSPSSPS